MALSDPTPGLVIRYAYLWRSEVDRGREEASKDRPCAVVLAVQQVGKETRVWVAPITHALPRKGAAALEIPAATKQRLGLDDQQSWIVTSEVNSFRWPGQDIRPVPTRQPGEDRRFEYGHLGPRITTAMIEGVREQRRQGRSKIIGRDEIDSTELMRDPSEG